ncbi:MAG TPA: SDR family oxidoreductase [Methylomirabilota bacterium]|nr:SDR family oxidoreductase [Methylomirabilota bacterium]
MSASETVLITGASSGIGLELAKCFAADGNRLILVARNTEALEKLAEELRRKNKIEAVVLTADLSLPETPKKIFEKLRAQNISVDVLVNNAGFGAIGAFEQLPLERQIEMIHVNVTALTELTRLFLPEMVQRRRGSILNVGSVAGFVPGPGMAVYYATKAFVQSFSEALAAELKGSGVTVTVLCPGPTPTNFGTVAGSKNVRLIRVSRTSVQKVAHDGHKALRDGKTVCVSGIQNQFLVFLIRLVPRTLIRRITLKFNGFRRS